MKMHNFFRIFQKLFLKLAGITKGDLLTTVSVAHAVRVGKYEYEYVQSTRTGPCA